MAYLLDGLWDLCGCPLPHPSGFAPQATESSALARVSRAYARAFTQRSALLWNAQTRFGWQGAMRQCITGGRSWQPTRTAKDLSWKRRNTLEFLRTFAIPLPLE